MTERLELSYKPCTIDGLVYPIDPSVVSYWPAAVQSGDYRHSDKAEALMPLVFSVTHSSDLNGTN